jgi:hypothetical protein
MVGEMSQLKKYGVKKTGGMINCDGSKRLGEGES